jgi:farnesyl diphosphate synthase
MAGGQAIDLASVGKPLTGELRDMHQLKTGALLQASVPWARPAAASPGGGQAALGDYGAAGPGVPGGGRHPGRDRRFRHPGQDRRQGRPADKPTYVSLLGLAPARALAERLRAQAHDALGACGLPDVAALRALADQVVQRTH